MANAFIDCTSLSFSYDVMGIVTVSYTMVHEDPSFHYETSISAGGQNFQGYVSSATLNRIPNTNWYETHVTLTASTNGAF